MGHGLHDATSPIQAALRDAQSLSGDGYTSWMLNTTSEDVVAVTDVEWLKVSCIPHLEYHLIIIIITVYLKIFINYG